MTDRNHLLDGLRGVAALGVLLFHIGDILHTPVGTGGYLAVDFFFVLSGFVIARAYDRRLAGGLSAGRFVAMRIQRLYPLFLVGIVLGFGKALAQTVLHTANYLDAPHLLLATVCNALMLPYPLPYPHFFPLNSPGWSLSFEMLVNILYAVLLVRLARGGLIVVTAIAGMAIVAGPLLTGSEQLVAGNDLPYVAFGFARVMFSFPLGMLLARGIVADRRHASAWSFGLAAAIVLVLLVDVPRGAMLARDLGFVFVGSPLILWAGARMEVPRWAETPSAVLGDLSYPLYIIHYPILLGIALVGARLHLPPALVFALSLAVPLAAAFVAERWYDRPVRRWLSARLHLRESAKPQVV